MIRNIKLLMLAISTILLAACSSDDSPDEQPDDHSGTLAWSTCPGNQALDCATLNVPMNYGNEQAGEIEIALNRLPALQQPASGVLLINGGGPGASLYITELVVENEVLPESVLERYDVISFDPRGFGESTPISCDVPDNQASTDYLANGDMINTFVQQSTELAESCHTQLGDYLLQLGSMNVVRDMESIRQALDVEKLNFIGLSYGTRLAALYLQTYPERSEAFILDASENRDSTVLTWAKDVQPALQQNLESMLMQCSRTEPDCNPDELQQLLINRMNALVAEGNQEELMLLLGLVGDAAEESELADLLIAPLASYLLRGEVAGLEALVVMLESDDGDEDEDDDEVDENDMTFSVGQRAVLCADDAFRPTETDLIGYLEDFNTRSDFFAETYIDVAGACAGWPESPDPLPPIATSTAPMSLVIGGTSDTTSPIAWSEAMANAVGGYFLASSHDDHTVVYQGESECVDNIVTEFLVDGQLPSAGDCL